MVEIEKKDIHNRERASNNAPEKLKIDGLWIQRLLFLIRGIFTLSFFLFFSVTMANHSR